MKHDMSDQELLVVLGMHRAGTSAVARGLLTLNVALGDRLEPAAAGINEKGYWEDIDIVALNVEMLRVSGSNWHFLGPIRGYDVERLRSMGYLIRAVDLLRGKLVEHGRFGFKDPRTARMLPFWMEAFELGGFNVKYVLTIRNPLSVVKSLTKRDHFDPEKSYWLWVGHVVTSLLHLRGKRLAVVDYDALMRRADVEIPRIAKNLGLTVDSDRLRLYAEEFLDEKLQHSAYRPEDLRLDDAAPPLACEIYKRLLEVSAGRSRLDDPAVDAEVLRWVREYQRLESTLRLTDKYQVQVTLAEAGVSERDARIASLSEELANRVARVAELDQSVAAQDQQIVQLKDVIKGREEGFADAMESLAARDGRIVELEGAVANREAQCVRLAGTIEEIRASTSWRVTAPMRSISTVAQRALRALRLAPQVIRVSGGLLPAASKAARILVTEGPSGVRQRLRWFSGEIAAPGYAAAPVIEPERASRLSIIPYFVDPRKDLAQAVTDHGDSVAIHIHLFYREMLGEFITRLASLSTPFDLYVSVSPSSDAANVRAEIAAALPHAGKIIVEAVPNKGRDLAPLIVQFGARLSCYDVIGHFHTKKSPHSTTLADWGSGILDELLGMPGNPGGRISHILELLRSDAKVVYPEGNTAILKDPTGWAGNYELARALLEKHTSISIVDFPVVEFSEGSMFWARASCLREFLALPLRYDDFRPEPIPADGTLAHALERLILVFASAHQGACYRLHKGDSIHDYRHYEEQGDYSSSIVHRDIKILAYYLPQFHPIPENDLWHGKGFTEWTKVRAANPLFEGHYQQHIPHPNLGYYLIDSAQTLRRQAEMMRKSGVYGQVFYHYSFGGKLILEEPAKLLLENPDVAMPFCFCWANENWTRRWDGNEDQILLAQKYSKEDALGFIEYLIPFFRDPRYILVDGRPVLFIYRPASIPNVREYLSIWEAECARSGVGRPFVVAVLTRGATDPRDFGMDAGVERALHDWTAGVAPDIKEKLRAYHPMKGSVLSYDDVVRVYTGQTDSKEFTYFRSVVPTWDNTARYGPEAYLVHGATPERFQEWLQSSIRYATATLPEDRRIVLVNAWNEWAEGAHLEPDSRFGYSYLNAVGRSLSDISYSNGLNPVAAVPSDLRVVLSIAENALAQLRADADLRERMEACLVRSTAFRRCQCTITQAMADMFPALSCPHGDDLGGADVLIEIRRLSLFDPTVFEKMLQTACQYPSSVVMPNAYDRSIPLVDVTDNGSVHSHAAYGAPVVLIPLKGSDRGYRNYRIRADARCFVCHPSAQAPNRRPEVTTIIRFHKSGDFALLRNALYCLAAMRDCVVIPLVAAQDLSTSQQMQLEEILEAIPFASDVRPIVKHYCSVDGNGDLRSKMLTESLLQVRTRYAAFLDYDDMLMSDAYAWLLERLQRSGKAVAFGRVYVATYDGRTGLILARARTFDKDYVYESFKEYNYAPLHSFMLDLSRLDLRNIAYHDDQRYLEDYFLTLQLFRRENVDWDSLAERVYIGDYVHSVDREHTLAVAEGAARRALLGSPEYRLCEERVEQMRRALP